MKKTIILSLLLGGMGLTACSDLDVDIDSRYTKYPDNPIAIEAKLADVYYGFRGAYGRRYPEAAIFNSDEATAVTFGSNWWDNGNYSHPTFHNFSPDDACVGDLCDQCLSTITKCNTLVLEMGEEAAAPARLIRAFCHFMLIDNYGDMPVMDHNSAADEEVLRQPRAEVAKFIESELLDLINNHLLTEEVSANTYGKPTRWVAEALLAKLYLNWNVYAAASPESIDPNNNPRLNDCVAHCDALINSHLFEIGNDYMGKFAYNNGPQFKDFIYALPFDGSSAKGMNRARFHTMRYANKAEMPYVGCKLGKSTGGTYAVNPEFADLFCLPGDQRNNAILTGPVYVLDPVTALPTSERSDYKGQLLEFTREITPLNPNSCHMDLGDNIDGWRQGAKINKFHMGPEGFGINGYDCDNDMPIFRYADVLLEKAEAITRGASATLGQTAQTLLSEVRTASSAPALDTNPTLQDILDERGRELCFECWRRNDLIRYGKFEDDWGFKNRINANAKTDKRMRLMPIPTFILERNTSWSQNPGYPTVTLE